MNATEAAYAEILEARRIKGEVLAYWFEAVRFKLADSECTYTPDFMVFLANGEIELHEVKGGYIYDDSIVKLKTAASLYPFRFIMITKEPKKLGGAFKTVRDL